MSSNTTINITPNPSLFDQNVKICAKDLPVEKVLTVHSHCTVYNGMDMECITHYKSNQLGCIDLTKDESLGGIYTGVQPMGLFLGMKESYDSKNPYAHMLRLDTRKPFVVSIRVYNAIIGSLKEISALRKEGKLDEMELAKTEAQRLFLVDGVTITSFSIEKHGFIGTLFLPPGDGPFPGVMTLGVGHAALYENIAAQLCSRGFAALALQTFLDEDDLVTEVDMEVTERAIRQLRNHPKVDGRRGIGVMGTSATSYLALAMAECLEGIKCVVWINGFVQAMFFGIKYKNELIPKGHIDWTKAKRSEDGLIELRHCHPQSSDPNSLTGRKPMFHKKHETAYLFIAGLNDMCLPADVNVQIAEKLLSEANHPNYQILRYAGAGHIFFPPFTACPRILPSVCCPQNYHNCDYGGDFILHCRAQEDSWIQQLEFLRSNLSSTEVK